MKARGLFCHKISLFNMFILKDSSQERTGETSSLLNEQQPGQLDDGFHFIGGVDSGTTCFDQTIKIFYTT